MKKTDRYLPNLLPDIDPKTVEGKPIKNGEGPGNLDTRTFRALTHQGFGGGMKDGEEVINAGVLAETPEQSLLKVWQIGPKSVGKIKSAVRAHAG